MKITDRCCRSERNKRNDNQDLGGILEYEQSPGSQSNCCILMVLDGVSNNGGRLAAQCCAASLRQSLARLAGSISLQDEAEQKRSIPAQLCEAILLADEDVRQQYPGCGTTVSLALIYGNQVYAANVGDSPIYLFRQGPTVANSGLEPLFECQNLAGQKRKAGLCSEEEALTSPDRNQLLEMVGGTPGSFYLSRDQIHTQCAVLSPGCMVLAGSDGALAVFPEGRMKELFFDYRNEPLAGMVEELFAEVEESASEDNATVAAVTIDAF